MNDNLNQCVSNVYDKYKPAIKNDGLLTDLHKNYQMKEESDFIIT